MTGPGAAWNGGNARPPGNWAPTAAPHPHWLVGGASVVGSSHARRYAPGEDAIRWSSSREPPAEWAVLCLSDGHGSNRCFRSYEGARIAVRVGTELGEQLARDILWAESNTAAVTAADRSPLPPEDLARNLVDSWVAGVTKHLATHPVAADELSRAGVAFDAVDSDPLLVYGATVLLAVAVAGRVVIAQLGDGDAVVVTTDGRAVLPLPPDYRLFADETTSLCLPDAAQSVRVVSLDVASDAIGLLLVSTDGYGNAFAEDDWYTSVAADLHVRLRDHGARWIFDRLESWLQESAGVGGDDVTVGLLVPSATAQDRRHAVAATTCEGHAGDAGEVRTHVDDPAATGPRRAGQVSVVVAVLAFVAGVLMGSGVAFAVLRQLGEPSAPTTPAAVTTTERATRQASAAAPPFTLMTDAGVVCVDPTRAVAAGGSAARAADPGGTSPPAMSDTSPPPTSQSTPDITVPTTGPEPTSVITEPSRKAATPPDSEVRQVALLEGVLWTITQTGIARLDDGGTVEPTIMVDKPLSDLEAADGVLWAATRDGLTVVRVAPGDGGAGTEAAGWTLDRITVDFEATCVPSEDGSAGALDQ